MHLGLHSIIVIILINQVVVRGILTETIHLGHVCVHSHSVSGSRWIDIRGLIDAVAQTGSGAVIDLATRMALVVFTVGLDAARVGLKTEEEGARGFQVKSAISFKLDVMNPFKIGSCWVYDHLR